MADAPIDAVDIASAQVTVQPANITVTDGSVVRVVLGAISGTVDAGTGEFTPDTYGLKVVSSDGSTVIIDGTSNMFKIAATGTLTRAFPAVGTNAFSSVTVSSGYSAMPAMLFSTALNDASLLNTRAVDFAPVIALATGVTQYYARAFANLASVPGGVTVTLEAASATVNPGTTAATRYYILIEVGI
jgi:hypothetical protein